MTINKANGWLASDNTFFNSQTECERYDSRLVLTEAVLALGVDESRVEKLIDAIHELTPQIKRYINAHTTDTPVARGDTGNRNPDTNKNRKHKADGKRAEGQTTSVQSQPDDGRSDLSNLGRNSSTEAVRE